MTHTQTQLSASMDHVDLGSTCTNPSEKQKTSSKYACEEKGPGFIGRYAGLKITRGENTESEAGL